MHESFYYRKKFDSLDDLKNAIPHLITANSINTADKPLELNYLLGLQIDTSSDLDDIDEVLTKFYKYYNQYYPEINACVSASFNRDSQDKSWTTPLLYSITAKSI